MAKTQTRYALRNKRTGKWWLDQGYHGKWVDDLGEATWQNNADDWYSPRDEVVELVVTARVARGKP